MAKASGVVGLWTDDHLMMEAARKIRGSGYTKIDAVTPFPVHGLEEAMGLKRSFIPWVTLCGGIIGGSFGLWLERWVSAISWPLNVGGKPFFSGPAFVPIIFELTILIAALSSVVTLFGICGLPKLNPPVLDPEVTSHKFAIFISDKDAAYDFDKVSGLLKSLGANEVKKISRY